MALNYGNAGVAKKIIPNPVFGLEIEISPSIFNAAFFVSPKMNEDFRENNKIRVVFARNPPDAFSNCARFPSLDASTACPFPGWTVEILKMVTDYLGYEIIPIVTTAPDGLVDWGSYVSFQDTVVRIQKHE